MTPVDFMFAEPKLAHTPSLRSTELPYEPPRKMMWESAESKVAHTPSISSTEVSEESPKKTMWELDAR